ncbi:MAG: isocitrate lyase/PEP mutase family protein [Candidatus Hydrogenedentes bacterium]|nr:isocitrate lyase/PEP mutase family protein [Candidatus Hydrogenedentota bacterium]
MVACQKLRGLLESERPLVMPDAYDALSARLIEMAGFRAVQCSGFSMALALRAVPEPRLGFEDNLELTRKIVEAVQVPVMADGEDGFGGPERVFDVAAAYVEAGVSGINIEDQVLGSSKTKAVVDCELMAEKIRAAREGAVSKGAGDLVLNARTDALAVMEDRQAGLDEAIRRGNQYFSAGADLFFAVGVRTLEEARELVRQVNGPISVAAGLAYNITAMSIKDLRECGVARVSLPTIAVLSAREGIRRTLSIVRESEEFSEITAQGLLAGMDSVGEILGR